MVKLAIITTLFGLTALLYASVGFGGGSTYTALLMAGGADYRIVPLVALTCNILVVSGNSLRYAHQRLIRWNKLWPLLTLSVPAAWLGGRWVVSETLFIGLLWIALLLAGLRLLLAKPAIDTVDDHPIAIWQSAGIGACIGFYSGLVGIGGGIFLAPILHAMRWGNAKAIATACSLFILVNSVAGFAGQWTKLASLEYLPDALTYWPVLPAVVAGGFIGNRFGVFNLSQMLIKRLTALLILSVAIRLAVQWVGLVT